MPSCLEELHELVELALRVHRPVSVRDVPPVADRCRRAGCGNPNEPGQASGTQINWPPGELCDDAAPGPQVQLSFGPGSGRHPIPYQAGTSE